MALELENILNSTADAGENAQNPMAYEETSSANKLNIEDVDSPLDALNVFNIDEIAKDDQLIQSTLNDGLDSPPQNDALQQGGPGDPPSKKYTKQEIHEMSRKNAARAQLNAANTPAIASKSYSPYLAYAGYEFDRYKSNIDRYRGYGERTFRQLGFNPLEDNEKYYNQNTGFGKEFTRMAGQFSGMFGSAFTSNYRSIGNLLKGDEILSPDDSGDQAFAEANRLGGSQKGGLTGFANNLALNSAFTVGIIANIAVEEMAIAALASTRVGAPEAAVLQAGAISRTGSRLSQIQRGIRASLGGSEVGNILRGSQEMLRSITAAEKARVFYNGLKTTGTAGLKLVNPFRVTTETVSGIRAGTAGYRNLSNLGKMSATFGSFYRDVRNGWYAVSEAQLEGGGVMRDRIDDEINKYVLKNGKLPEGQDLENIYTNAYAASRVDVLGNIGLLYLTNKITFDGLFKFKGVKNLIETAEEAPGFFSKGLQFKLNLGSKSFNEVAKQGFFSSLKKAVTNPKKYAGQFLVYTKANLAEGVQELGQEWLSDATKKRYRSYYSDPAVSQADLLKSSVYSELLKTVTSAESKEALMSEVFSKRGLETFASGFLMQSMVGGAGRSLTTAANSLWNKSAELYLKKYNPAKFEEYMATKTAVVEKHKAVLDAMLNDANNIFSRKKESLSIQRAANANMAEAVENDDNYSFYNSKDEKTFDHVFTSLDAGTFKDLINGFKELNKLNDKELAEYFNIEDGSKAREKVGEYIQRAEQIKNRYDYFNSKFKNPFKPAQFKRGSEEQIKEFMAYRAFEDAKKDAIASQYGFDRALERMNNIYSTLSSNKPLSKMSESEMVILLNPNDISKEVKLLNEEASLLDESKVPGDKKLASLKRKKAEALQDFFDKYKDFEQNKEKTSVNPDTNQITIPWNTEYIEPLKKSYREYLKTISKITDEQLLEENVEKSLNEILDYYQLNEDSKQYTKAVNFLSNPNNLVRHAERIYNSLNDIYDDRLNIADEGINKYLTAMEVNQMTMALGMLGAVMDPEQLLELVENKKYPKNFYDLRNNQLISRGDYRYGKLMEIVDTFFKMQGVEETPVQEAAAEKSAEEVTPTEEKPAEPTPVVAPEVVEKKEEALPTDIQQQLRLAYDEFIAQTGADLTFEDFVAGHPIAYSIKAGAVKQPTVKEEEAPTPAAGFNVGDRVKINTEKDGESVIKEDRGDKVLLEDGRQVAKKNLSKLEQAPEVKEEVVTPAPASPVSDVEAKKAALEGKPAETLTEQIAKDIEKAEVADKEAQKKKLEEERDRRIEEEAPIKTLDYPLGYFTESGLQNLTKISELVKGTSLDEDQKDYLKVLEIIALNLAKAGVQPLYSGKQSIDAIKKVLANPSYYGALRKSENNVEALANQAIRLVVFFEGTQVKDVPMGFGLRFADKKSDYGTEQFKESATIQAKLSPDKYSEKPEMGYVAALRWAQMKLAGKTNRSLGEYLLNTQKEIRDDYQAKIDALEGAKLVEPVVEEVAPTVQNKINSILSSISSIKDFPMENMEDKTDATNSLLALINSGEATANDVMNAVKARREEMFKNLKPSDLVRGDIVTFTDGRKGIVNFVTNSQVKIKVYGTPEGQLEIIDAKNLSTKLSNVQNSKQAIEEETGEVEITEENKKTMQQSKTAADGFINNEEALKKATNDAKKVKDDENPLDDIFNNLGCDT